MATYQVVAEAAHVKNSAGMKLIYKGALVPDDCDPDRLKHLVDTGMVKEVGSASDTALAPNAAIVPEENATTGGQRLAADGSVKPAVSSVGGSSEVPDGRASNATLVDYLVGKGFDKAELEKADRKTLQRMVQDQQ